MLNMSLYRELIKMEDSFKLYLELWDEVEYNQPFVSSLDRDNVGLIAKFRPLGARPAHKQSFCVATTHLLYNPKRHDVKLAQLAVLLAGCKNIKRIWNTVIKGT